MEIQPIPDEEWTLIDLAKPIGICLAFGSTLAYGGYLLLDTIKNKIVNFKNMIIEEEKQNIMLSIDNKEQQIMVVDKGEESVYEPPPNFRL